jgi:hypothetical protein
MQNNETNIEFKIYRDGRYDRSANIKMKIRNKWPVVETAINNFFTNH